MTRKYWAARRGKRLGPFLSREEAVEAGRILMPKRPDPRDAYSTGYGEFGPSFDIRFHEKERA